MTWEELTAFVEDWIRYGDDPFEDAYSWILALEKEETNEEQKVVYRSVLKFMAMLEKYVFKY